MTGRSFRVGLAVGLLAGAALAVTVARRRSATTEPAVGPAPAPAVPAAPSAPSAPDTAPEPVAEPAPAPVPDAWVTPLDGGSCPPSHPVKAKLGSGIFHLPGMAMYGRTRADRCYCTPEAAEADGLRRSIR